MIASWNIKQLADKDAKARSVLGQRDTDWMAAVIRAAQADVVVVLEVMLALGARGIAQIAAALGGTWQAMATSNNAFRDLKPDRYGVLWRSDRVRLLAADYPSLKASFAPGASSRIIQSVAFPNRNPGRFRFQTVVPPPGTPVPFDVICLHGPEPKQQGGADARRAMESLAELDAVVSPTAHTIICGDFNVDEITTPAPYATIEAAGPTYRRVLTHVRTSYKMQFASLPDPGTPAAHAYDNLFVPSVAEVVDASEIDFVTRGGRHVGPPLGPLEPYGVVPAQEAAWDALLYELRNRVSDHMLVAVAL